MSDSLNMNLTKRIVSVAALVVAGCLVWQIADTDDGYELIWSDEFEGDSLDRNKWNVEVNGYGGWNDELQYYCDSPENITVSDGTLKIRALKQEYEGKKYTSAKINTMDKESFQYGRIEARMKLPEFQGAWPAFWMLGARGETWPQCGEIDILETVNDESIAYGTAHWAVGDSYDSSGSSTLEAGVQIDITQWHTYRIEWDKNQIQWYVDDVRYHVVDLASDSNKESLTKPQYILLNLAIGGQWPGFDIDDDAFPAVMEVDYVRVYQKKI